jgi:hypothetical protein
VVAVFLCDEHEMNKNDIMIKAILIIVVFHGIPERRPLNGGTIITFPLLRHKLKTHITYGVWLTGLRVSNCSG